MKQEQSVGTFWGWFGWETVVGAGSGQRTGLRFGRSRGRKRQGVFDLGIVMVRGQRAEVSSGRTGGGCLTVRENPPSRALVSKPFPTGRISRRSRRCRILDLLIWREVNPGDSRRSLGLGSQGRGWSASSLTIPESAPRANLVVSRLFPVPGQPDRRPLTPRGDGPAQLKEALGERALDLEKTFLPVAVGHVGGNFGSGLGELAGGPWGCGIRDPGRVPGGGGGWRSHAVERGKAKMMIVATLAAGSGTGWAKTRRWPLRR
jgi:hypothetical protein